MGMLAITHLACALAFTALAALIAAGKPSNRTGWHALAACVLTAAWAGMVGFRGLGLAGAIPLLESLRTLAWLVFAGSLLLPPGDTFRTMHLGRRWLVAAPLLAVLVVAGDASQFAASPTWIYLNPGEVFGRIALAVFGLLIVENLYRNSTEQTRWQTAPICIALGGIFAFELMVYSDMFLSRRTDPVLISARALADALAVPFITLAMARNRNWRVDIHVSRTVVFHTATFVASGLFLMAVGAAGTILREYGGDWGVVGQLSLVFGGVLVLATALTSGGMRSRVRHFIAENFFSHRYDYRAEWVNFIDTLSSAQDADLQERVIRAVAHIVESPAGVLWQFGEGTYRPGASWNMPLPRDGREAPDTSFVAGFGEGDTIQHLEQIRSTPAAPEWLSSSPSAWLAVPLPHQGRLIGFLVLARPHAPFRIDWEADQLMRIVARQAASYLSEEQAVRALIDARMLEDYSKRFAFVVHDIKNLVSQLSLILSNAEKFGSNPLFQEDALHTIRSSVERMNKLLQQLRTAQAPAGRQASADVEQVIQDVLAGVDSDDRVLKRLPGRALRVSMDPGALHSSLTHLINNALEAAGKDGAVTVRVESQPDRVLVEVSDQGPGMDAAFIRNELFRPFRSTKASGHGIGAFQTRELIRAAGGELEVISKPGAGTTMRVVLPAAKQSDTIVVPAA